MSNAMYLKIEGPPIEGESTTAAHDKELEILSFNHGVGNNPSPRSTSGSPSAGRSSHQDMSIMKYIDKASPKLAESVCKGTVHGTVTISVARTDGQGGEVVYLKYILTEVIFSNVSLAGSKDGDLPTESLTMNYGTIKWEYQPTSGTDASSTGTVPFKWDVAKNQPA